MASVKVGLGVFCFCDPPNIRFMVWAPRRFDRIYVLRTVLLTCIDRSEPEGANHLLTRYLFTLTTPFLGHFSVTVLS